MSEHSAIGWTNATCRPCGAILTDENRVERGRRLCKTCRSVRQRAAYVKKGHPGRRGWLTPIRDGDKKQARRRINYLVEQGFLPCAADVSCTDCADHLPEPGGRHEYDHALGYDGVNQLYAEVVCQRCHRNREELRCG